MKPIRLRVPRFNMPVLFPQPADYRFELRASMASDELAQAIYLATQKAYQTDVRVWSELAIHEKNAYREVAARVIQALPPPKSEMSAKVYRFCDRLARDRHA